MAESKKTVEDFLASQELEERYHRLLERGLYSRDMRIGELRTKIVRSTFTKLIQSVLENPRSPKVGVWLNLSKNVLGKSETYGTTMYHEAVELLIDATLKSQKNPELVAKLLGKIYEKCSLEYIQGVCDQTKNKQCFDLMVKKLKLEVFENKVFNHFYDKALCYKYAYLAKDENLLRVAMNISCTSLTLQDKDVSLLTPDVNWQPFFKHLKHADTKFLTINAKEIKPEIMKELVSGYAGLEHLECHVPCDVPAEWVLTNPNLKEIDFCYTHVNEPEKIIEHAEKLEDVHIESCDAQALYAALERRKPDAAALRILWVNLCDGDVLYKLLMKKKPGNVDDLSANFTRMQANSLMQKYLTMCVQGPGRDGGFYSRNKEIIKAKRRGNFNELIDKKEFVTYLEVIDQKDRPSFETLYKKDSWRKSCFERMRNSYEEDYLQTLDQIYDLCDFGAQQPEAEIFRAVQNKCFMEHLSALPAEKRMPITKLIEPLTKGEGMLIGEISKVYDTEPEFKSLVKGLFELYQPSSEELQKLAECSMLSDSVKEYEEKKKYTQNAEATKSAFEKWKEEHQKGM